MSRRTPEPTRAAIRAAIRAGVSNRRAAEEHGVSSATVQRIRASMPFSGGPQGPPLIPPLNYNASDQPAPPPSPRKYEPRYHGHTFRASMRPSTIDGWSLERIRQAITLHDQGLFAESSALSVVATRFGPVFAALGQALAPALALPRFVRGGERGLSRVLREEVEAQIAPRGGLLPSPYFPPTLWGSMQFDVAQMGFSVLQHVHGDEHPETGVRPIFTRRWPTWATQWEEYRRTYVAQTTEGPVDIVSGDGKFTLIGDTETPHEQGAIRALGLEVLDGALVKQARASYVDRYGNPKWVATMPPGVSTHSPEGDDFFMAVQTIQGPDGVGVFPYDSSYTVEQMTAQQSTVFKDSLDNIWQYVAAIVLGTDGTMSPSTGVYSAPIFAGVRRDIVDRRLKAMVRGVNGGHIASYLDFNYSTSIEMASGWTTPVLEIPLPDPEADARIKSFADRVLMLVDIVEKQRAAGFFVTQDDVNELAKRLEVPAPEIDALALATRDVGVDNIVTVNEIRGGRGLTPFVDERGKLTQPELEAEAEAQREERRAAAEAEREIEVSEETEDDAGDDPSEPDEVGVVAGVSAGTEAAE